MILGLLDTHLKKKIVLYPYLTPHTNTNSSWIADLNMKVIEIKLLEKNGTTSL